MEKTMINAFDLLKRVREQQPVVHHITNWVTIYDCANIVKIMGASPVMAHAVEEVADMAHIASSMVLNIGTLTVDLVEAMKKAALSANKKGIPVVLDVCGAGATPLRDAKVRELLTETRVSIIKGNASEIARTAGENVTTKGVDSTDVSTDMKKVAGDLARHYDCTVVVTGPEDVVTDGKVFYCIANGHALMAHVVGTGCMAASVIGAFAAVEPDLALAAAAALVCYEVVAECAAKNASGPARFKELLFDGLYSLDKETVTTMQKVSI